MAVTADDGEMKSHCEIVGSKILTPGASFVTCLIFAEATDHHSKKIPVLKVGVSDHVDAHHHGGKNQ